MLEAGPVERRRIVVRGVVQGVGFRPFVLRTAAELQLTGHCGNDEGSVFIEAEGPARSLDELVRRLHVEPPPLAVIDDVASETVALEGDASFRIVASRSRPGARTLVSPDVGTCADCLAELGDPADRRWRHPFITCTNCGPRFTIIEDLPYDRPATTMGTFTMCARCEQEYDDPNDRRQHAQPIACHDCGPRMWLEENDRAIVDDDAVLGRVQQLLRDGAVVAVKGVGGFHLACDAGNPETVRLLRERKHRPDKPFAVMTRDLAAARVVASISAEAAAALTQPARPIVLLPSRGVLVAEIAPGLDEVGVMLPYTALHQLLFAPLRDSRSDAEAGCPPVLVMTSGNLADEPLCYTNDDARYRLSELVDAFLMHDRDIAVPCDDSVVGIWDGAELPVRRSRGYAPLPVVLSGPGPVTLAVGAEVKNTFCLTRDEMAFCSGHLGDMGSLESQIAFGAAVEQMTALQGAVPELVVADEHPAYATRRWAEQYAAEHDVPLLTVQHHHAHVASLLAEHGRLGERVLGVAFDGTGYGCDRSVWGGELLLVGGDVGKMIRVGHLEPFALSGGDRAVRNPFRVALSLLAAAGIPDAEGLDLTVTCRRDEQAVVRAQLVSGLGCVATTSVGRLFDGVASLLGVRHTVSYEAQAAIELEALARTAAAPVPLVMEVEDDQLLLGRLVRDLVDGVQAGRSRAGLALGFHRALATATAQLVGASAGRHGVTTVGLTGGVFANRVLLGELTGLLRVDGLTVLTHRRVPPNDGGLSLGQAVVGRARSMAEFDATTGATR